jgi:hypothetical protein
LKHIDVSSSKFYQSTFREQRLSFCAPVTIFFPFAPWQIACSTRSVNISTSGILLFTDATRPNQNSLSCDISAMLTAEPQVTLQIEHQISHLFIPVLHARCVRTNFHTSGVEYAFAFDQTTDDLIALIDELDMPTPTYQ